MIFNNLKAKNWKLRLKNYFSGPNIDSDQIQAWEELLFEADFAFGDIENLLVELKSARNENSVESLKAVLLDYYQNTAPNALAFEIPSVCMLIGVNGAGKTTFSAKLANYLKSNGHRVILGAADTFRAGAVEQLKIWASRLDIHCVEQGMNADPASVAFEAWKHTKAENAVLILDTAGRLHTKAPLMEQMAKIVRVLSKEGDQQPQETWLVLDGSSGQNLLAQATEFAKQVKVTGLIVTKLDGSSKGGAALSASKALDIPIRFIGLGESVEDIQPFDLSTYVNAMLTN